MVWTFKRKNFSEQDFSPCEVFSNQESQNAPTKDFSANPIDPELTIETEQCVTPPPTRETPNIINEVELRNMPSTSQASDGINETLTTKSCITPEVVRPYPKIIRTNSTREGKGKGKSQIYTDTPEKQRIEELQRTKDEANIKKEQRKLAKDLKAAQNLLGIIVNPEKKPNKRRRTVSVQSDSSNSSANILLQESFDSSDSNTESSDDDIVNTAPPAANDLHYGDYIITKVINVGKKNPYKHFVGKIVSRYPDNNDFLVSFLKLKPTGTFVFPDIKDETSVNISDIVLKLPDPIVKKGTSRTASLFKFKINMSSYNISMKLIYLLRKK